jgi:transcriptional regulator with XRE-family HTH domain
MKTHEEMVAGWIEHLEFKAEYDALEEEFAVFEALIAARKAAGLSQAEVAKRMGTKAPAIARLESAGGKHKPSPSLNTLRRYANAVGCKLEIKLLRREM